MAKRCGKSAKSIHNPTLVKLCYRVTTHPKSFYKVFEAVCFFLSCWSNLMPHWEFLAIYLFRDFLGFLLPFFSLLCTGFFGIEFCVDVWRWWWQTSAQSGNITAATRQSTSSFYQFPLSRWLLAAAVAASPAASSHRWLLHQLLKGMMKWETYTFSVQKNTPVEDETTETSSKQPSPTNSCGMPFLT